MCHEGPVVLSVCKSNRRKILTGNKKTEDKTKSEEGKVVKVMY